MEPVPPECPSATRLARSSLESVPDAIKAAIAAPYAATSTAKEEVRDRGRSMDNANEQTGKANVTNRIESDVLSKSVHSAERHPRGSVDPPPTLSGYGWGCPAALEDGIDA